MGAQAGMFYGVQTLLQLLPADIFRVGPDRRDDLARPLRRDRGPAALRLARRAPRRRPPLHAQVVRAQVHRPAGAAQAQHLPLAPDRRPGLAHRDQEVPEAHRGRRVAQGDAGRPLEPQPRQIRSTTASGTAASTRRTTSARSWPTPPRATSPSCRRSRCPATRRRRSPPIPELGNTGPQLEVARDVGHHRQTSSTPTEQHLRTSCRTCWTR